MGFKKAFKKFRKALGIPAVTLGNVAKVGVAASTGGLGGVGTLLAGQAIKSKLKSAGAGAAKILRTKAEKALHARVVKARITPTPVAAGAAQTMPGGAPLNGRASTGKRRRKAAVAKAPKAPKRSSGGRKPPKGGKDFKALSASWKAAGKPGTWLAWVKSH